MVRQVSTVSLDLHTWEYGKDYVYASMELDGVFSADTFTAYCMGSDYGYSLDNHFRHLYFDVRTGDFTDVLMSSTIISQDMDIVENAYQNIILNNLKTEHDVTAYAAELEKAGKLVSYVFQSIQN